MTEKRDRETVYGARLVCNNQEKCLNERHSRGQEDKTHKYRSRLAVFVTVTITTSHKLQLGSGCSHDERQPEEAKWKDDINLRC